MDHYCLSLLQRFHSNQFLEGRYCVDFEAGEFLCPLCKSLSNVLLPILDDYPLHSLVGSNNVPRGAEERVGSAIASSLLQNLRRLRECSASLPPSVTSLVAQFSQSLLPSGPPSASTVVISNTGVTAAALTLTLLVESEAPYSYKTGKALSSLVKALTFYRHKFLSEVRSKIIARLR
jgi:hypothetical protein